MKINKVDLKEFLQNFLKQKVLVALVILVIISLIVTVSLLVSGSTSSRGGGASDKSNPRSVVLAKPTKEPFNLFGLFNPEKKKNSGPQSDGKLASIPPNSTSGAAGTVTKINPDGSKSTQTVAVGGTTQTSQGTINTKTNIAQDLGSNTEVDNIRIVFQNPDGSTTTYVPPGTPPDEVRWARYTNNKDKYAINYPQNWQFVYSIDGSGNEGIALYPSDANLSDPGAPYIGFGITDSFLLPGGAGSENSYATQITVDGVSGTLYTNGPLGDSYIAAVMQYSGKYFGLGSSISSETFAYVYYYMLYSLTFNIQ